MEFLTSHFFQTIIDGMTKSVKFDENGRRSEIEIQVSTLSSQGSTPIATWDSENGIKHIENPAPPPGTEDSSILSLQNRTFIVLTALVSKENILYIK